MSPFHDMLENELVSLDKEQKGIQWPLQEDLTAEDDVPSVLLEKKVRHKCVEFVYHTLFSVIYLQL